ncbi:FAD dependent oxidoreductase-domain-containing protein [Lineolata rhizophorae]|uniref:FAD dependent oxidoreductase-domain-containing protein n=1 Tax=Lineolata rhizophorae TaxID=578093 RepID=A0A6A6NRN6_9PEZI|nr:FAD dependent oxidoreductase-domain-containing protein [Lineolata rhizophorae]
MSTARPPESSSFPPSTPSSLPVPNPTSSFWLSDLSNVLRGHRTTPDLPQTADVVIIGTGITGASAARFLTSDPRFASLFPSASSASSFSANLSRHACVLQLEAREACSGATGRNGGHLQTPLLPTAREPAVGAFELRNYHAVTAYVAAHAVDCEFRALPACHTFWNADTVAAAKAARDELSRSAPELARLVHVVAADEGDGTDELRRMRVPDARGAAVVETAASLWPYKLVAAQLVRLVRGGSVNLQTNTPVERIERAGEGAAAGAGRRLRYALRTPRGSVRARHVLLATNAYTSALVPAFADLIVPVRGQMSALLPPPGAPRLDHSYGFLGARGQPGNFDDYLVQRPFSGRDPRGQLMFGGGRGANAKSPVGVSDDGEVDEKVAEYLRESLKVTMSLGGEDDGRALKDTHMWTGIMGYSRDAHPWVGSVPGEDGMWMAAGYTGHGMPNGTLCGKAAVELLLADEAGESAKATEERLVRDDGLPPSYLISEERIRRARLQPEIAAVSGLVSSARVPIASAAKNAHAWLTVLWSKADAAGTLGYSEELKKRKTTN